MNPLMQFIYGSGRKRSYILNGGSRSYNAIDPAVGNIKWSITAVTGANNTTLGYIQWDGYDTGSPVNFANQHAFTEPLDEWTTIYVRLTAVSGTVDSTTHAIDGTTWHTLTEGGSSIQWTTTHNTSTPQVTTVGVEFATDALGANIVASGNYTSTVASIV